MSLFTDRNLTILMGVGVVGGTLLGIAAQATGSEALVGAIGSLKILGDLFLAALRMVVVPVVFFAVVSGLAAMPHSEGAGKRILTILLFFATTTLIAVVLGQVLTAIVRPGIGVSQEEIIAQLPPEIMASAEQTRAGLKAPETFDAFLRAQMANLFMNPFKAMAEANFVGIVFFGLILGYLVMRGGDQFDAARSFFIQMNELMLTMVRIVVWLGPPGIFALAANLFATVGLDLLRPLAYYVLVVFLGLFLHCFVVYPLLMVTLAGYSPWRFFVGMKDAMVLALSTASSAATMPVTLRCTEENLGIDRNVTRLVVPMGATINMDGTALYEAVAAAFVAQLFFGHDLGIGQQAILALTATMAAIGAAGIPQAGLVTMVIVFKALNLPLELMAIIIVVDRPLDHMRTMVNVTGDSTTSVVMSRWFANK